MNEIPFYVYCMAEDKENMHIRKHEENHMWETCENRVSKGDWKPNRRDGRRLIKYIAVLNAATQYEGGI